MIELPFESTRNGLLRKEEKKISLKGKRFSEKMKQNLFPCFFLEIISYARVYKGGH